MDNCYLALFGWTLTHGAATLRHSLPVLPQSRPSQTAVKVKLSIFPGLNRSPHVAHCCGPQFVHAPLISRLGIPDRDVQKWSSLL